MCDCFKKAPKGGSMHEDSDLHNRNTKIASALRVCGSFFITCVSRRLFNPRISKRPQTHRICSIPYIFLTLEFSLTAANHAATCEHCTLRAFVLKWITAQREMTWGCWYFRRVKANQWGGEINTGGETVTDDLNKVWSRPQPREEPGCLIFSGHCNMQSASTFTVQRGTKNRREAWYKFWKALVFWNLLLHSIDLLIVVVDS